MVGFFERGFFLFLDGTFFRSELMVVCTSELGKVPPTSLYEGDRSIKGGDNERDTDGGLNEEDNNEDACIIGRGCDGLGEGRFRTAGAAGVEAPVDTEDGRRHVDVDGCTCAGVFLSSGFFCS